MRGQGATEYLLILGAIVLIAGIVVTAVGNTLSAPGNTNSDFNGLQGLVKNTGDTIPGQPPLLCGNGNIDSGEQCDTLNLGGHSCSDIGLNTGAPACSNSCAVDYSSCSYSGPVRIIDCNDLQNIDNNLSGSYVLATDIDCSQTTAWNWNGTYYQGFKPIGLNASFTGTLDGNGHAVTRLFIYRPSSGNTGLISYNDGGTIKNLGLVDENITGAGMTGGIAGQNEGGGIIQEVFATGAVTGGNTTGGVVGYNNSFVRRVFNTASVSFTSSGNVNTGGIAGENHSADAYSFTAIISDSYNSGKVTGYSTVGGIAGYNAGEIANSYNSGDVNANRSVGGITGRNIVVPPSATGNIHDSFNAGKVNGNTNSGAVAGFQGLGTGAALISNVYWFLPSGSSATHCAPPNIDTNCTQITSGAPQYFYSSSNPPLNLWDFTNTWQASVGNYPTLK